MKGGKKEELGGKYIKLCSTNTSSLCSAIIFGDLHTNPYVQQIKGENSEK